MKAKEYAAKYGPDIYGEDNAVSIHATSQLMVDMYNETQEIGKSRHVQFDRGLLPIIREQNEKWNAVVRIFEKTYGKQLLIENGYINFLDSKIPGVKERALNQQRL